MHVGHQSGHEVVRSQTELQVEMLVNNNHKNKLLFFCLGSLFIWVRKQLNEFGTQELVKSRKLFQSSKLGLESHVHCHPEL